MGRCQEWGSSETGRQAMDSDTFQEFCCSAEQRNEQKLKRSLVFKKGDITKCLYDGGNESVESGKLMLKEKEGLISVRGSWGTR